MNFLLMGRRMFFWKLQVSIRPLQNTIQDICMSISRLQIGRVVFYPYCSRARAIFFSLFYLYNNNVLYVKQIKIIPNNT